MTHQKIWLLLNHNYDLAAQKSYADSPFGEPWLVIFRLYYLLWANQRDHVFSHIAAISFSLFIHYNRPTRLGGNI